MPAFHDFEAIEVPAGPARIFVRRGGSGPPLLLLHGFPQTHLMWRDVASQLAHRFSIVCADLRGYGQSSCPPSAPDHAPYSKRTMATDMVEVMSALGWPAFFVAGHDRGGRVAYRLALDHPDRVRGLALLDVVATLDAWERADAGFVRAFWPWSLLAQPAPLPERLIAGAPDAVVDAALGGWGSPPGTFPHDVRRAYIRALRDPAHVHAICEEYRAAASIDFTHDLEDRQASRRMRCPLLVLWSARGGLQTWYQADGGPIALWRQWAQDVEGDAIDAGHFLAEECPSTIAIRLTRFFDRT